MVSSAPSVALSVLLLSVLLLIVALGLALLGATVLLPQGGAAVAMVLAAMAFLGSQVAVFKLFGLRSRADEVASTDDDVQENDEGDDPDWRAWKG